MKGKRLIEIIQEYDALNDDIIICEMGKKALPIYDLEHLGKIQPNDKGKGLIDNAVLIVIGEDEEKDE